MKTALHCDGANQTLTTTAGDKPFGKSAPRLAKIVGSK